MISFFVFAGILMFGCSQQTSDKNVTLAGARSFVEDDLRAKYPDAEVREIIDMTQTEGSWYVKARVTYNFSTACPVRIHVYYDYPKKGFIESPPEYITKDCRVCTAGQCIIATPEEAIIASHTMASSELAQAYIIAHSDAKPDAKFYAEYVDPETSTKYKNVWIVKWFSSKTNYATFVLISNSGEIIKLWQSVKTETV
jgi:hypothetical protein